MAEKDIIQNMIFNLGQSQSGRLAKELGIHYADVDERSPQELLRFTGRLSALIGYYGKNDQAPDGDWSGFFPHDEATIKKALENGSGDTTPHLALLLAFLELYKFPREVINRITGRHLDFYYQDVLRFSRKPSLPDKVHLLLELKKNAPPIEIGTQRFFSAGKDTGGRELLYAPARSTVINNGRVDSLRSLYVDPSGLGRVLHAPLANSSDGLGGELPGECPKWYAFGHERLSQAETGFALAAPVLRMREGTRRVTLSLTLAGVDRDLDDQILKDAFEAFVSGEKNWLGPFPVSPLLDVGAASGSKLALSFTIGATEKAVIDYDPQIHGYSYGAAAPLVQILLKDDCRSVGYNRLKSMLLLKASVAVEVSGLTALALENDGGSLDPQKAFLPFGSQPSAGSRFLIGCREALSKKLSELKISLPWKDAPANFASHYAGYDDSSIKNSAFTATVAFSDGGGWDFSQPGVKLFAATNASAEQLLTFKNGAPATLQPLSQGLRVRALAAGDSFWSKRAVDSYLLLKPVFSAFRKSAAHLRDGFISLTLERDFLQAAYRRKYVEKVMAYSKSGGTLSLPNEPYTPAIRGMTLSYKAASDTVDISGRSVSLDDFSNPDLQFFQIAYFGQMREHGYQRVQFAFLRDKNVSLLPGYDNRGELLIGLSNLKPGDSTSLLFQAAEGSADPQLARQKISWSVLCDNYWRPLEGSQIVLDTTNQLLTSGIITFLIPSEATTANTILPAGCIWLKGGVSGDVRGVSQLIQVAANALEARLTDNGNDPAQRQSVLEKGSISRLKNALPEIKSIRQPYASFGGRPAEPDNQFHTRVSERLRHKGRCITPWDYERIVLEAFPALHKVKCIPHATSECWLKPGNVLIVAVPDLSNRNAVNPLEPKVDAATLVSISDYLQGRCGMQVRIQAVNPRYQKIQLDFRVKFMAGCEPNFYTRQLDSELVRFLSPWISREVQEISFGGKVYKSTLLDFVEEREYVDYVTDFMMYSYGGEQTGAIDINLAQPETPDTILVSAKSHSIREA